MSPETLKSFEESKSAIAEKAAAIIARRAERVIHKKFLWLFLLGIPRLARLRALNRKANEFLAAKCGCACHK